MKNQDNFKGANISKDLKVVMGQEMRINKEISSFRGGTSSGEMLPKSPTQPGIKIQFLVTIFLVPNFVIKQGTRGTMPRIIMLKIDVIIRHP